MDETSQEEGAGAGAPQPTRRRALWIVLGAAGLLLVLGILFSVLQATVRSTTSQRVPVSGAESVRIDMEDGTAALTADGAGGDLDVGVSYFLRSPDIAVSDGPGVGVDVSCGWPSSCDADVTGSVPEESDVTLRADSGDLSVSGRPGVVDIRTESGDASVDGSSRDVRIASASGEVTVAGARGAVRAEAVAGDMELNGLSGSIRARSGEGLVLGEDLRSTEVEVEAGLGGVRLRFAVPPNRVEVDIGEGPAEITVPRGRYRIDADINQGDLVVEGIVEDPDADRRIVVRTLQGDATIEGL